MNISWVTKTLLTGRMRSAKCLFDNLALILTTLTIELGALAINFFGLPLIDLDIFNDFT